MCGNAAKVFVVCFCPPLHNIVLCTICDTEFPPENPGNP